MLADEIAAWPIVEQPGKVALESYTRCLAHPNFLAELYTRLRQNPQLLPYLGRINFDHQVHMLERGIRYLLEYPNGRNDAQNRFKHVAQSHKGLGLDESDLRTFVDVLIERALESDPQAKAPSQREAIREQWMRATEPGLCLFIELAAANQRRVTRAVNDAAA